MPRITIDFLNAQVARLNKIVLNDPNPSYSTIGAFTIDQAYGGVSLHKYTNENGCIDDIFRRGHMPKRQLSELISAFEKGLTFKKD